MQSQHADSHDTIAAQLRALAKPRTDDDLPGPSITPAATPEPAANEPSVRAAPLNDNAGDVRIPTPRARSGRSVAFLAICAGTAAAAWHFYGDQAKQRLSDLMPQFLAPATAPAPTPNTGAAEPQDAASQTAAPQPAAIPAPPQESSNPASVPPPEPAPTTPAAETPPAQASLPPEVTRSLETMAQEIASLKQTVEQLRAGQQQLSSDVAKISEHAARQKPAERASKPASRQRPRHASTPAVASRPVAPYSPPQTFPQRQIYPQGTAPREAYTPPPAPTQLPPQPGDSTAPRPPMPLH